MLYLDNFLFLEYTICSLSNHMEVRMNIVIVGAGKLGRTLTKHLSFENHNITIIDTKPTVVENIVNEYDVMGYCGNGASYDTQKNAGVAKANVLIATTASDEVNILCCLVAKKLGVKQTIARVTSHEYAKQVSLMSNELGISMTVNPELDAANEIVRILQFPNAIKVEHFANGKVNLVEFKIEKGSILHNKSLIALREKLQLNVLVCAVSREGEVFIPKGNFVLHEGDNVYITADAKSIVDFFKKLNILKDKLKSSMIIGGGKISYYTAQKLLSSGITVKIIEPNLDICNDLSDILPKAMIINGDGTNHELLLEEGLLSTDSLVSLTGMDETNIIISSFAKAQNCGKVITKVNNANYGFIIGNIGLDTVISPVEISSSNIIRYVRGMESTRGSEFKTLYRLVDNKVEALEFLISKKTSYTSIPLKDLKFKNDILLACIIRENNIIIPSGKDTIEPLDTLIIITGNSFIKDVSDIMR